MFLQTASPAYQAFSFRKRVRFLHLTLRRHILYTRTNFRAPKIWVTFSFNSAREFLLEGLNGI